jgi:TonB family protein
MPIWLALSRTVPAAPEMLPAYHPNRVISLYLYGSGSIGSALIEVRSDRRLQCATIIGSAHVVKAVATASNATWGLSRQFACRLDEVYREGIRRLLVFLLSTHLPYEHIPCAYHRNRSAAGWQSSTDWQSMKIQQTTNPGFPGHLLQVGVTKGLARVVISIGADGKLNECLVLGYTQHEFADTAVAALKQWKFVPAQWGGEPVGTVDELEFDFSTSGIVVTNPDINEIVEARYLRVRPARFIYLPCAAHALDQTPKPIMAVNPHYSAELAKRGIKGSVRIDFYIDEMGAVRLPSVSTEQDAVLTRLAIDALKQWKFSPPTSRGRPVLVKASQVFDFGNGS